MVTSYTWSVFANCDYSEGEGHTLLTAWGIFPTLPWSCCRGWEQTGEWEGVLKKSIADQGFECNVYMCASVSAVVSILYHYYRIFLFLRMLSYPLNHRTSIACIHSISYYLVLVTFFPTVHCFLPPPLTRSRHSVLSKTARITRLGPCVSAQYQWDLAASECLHPADVTQRVNWRPGTSMTIHVWRAKHFRITNSLE